MTIFKSNPRNNVANEDVSFDRPIYGFYHIYCANNWRSIFDEQYFRLVESGLLNVTKQLNICVIGTNIDVNYIKLKFIGYNVRIHQETDPTVFEFPMLKLMQEMAQNEQFLCYYFHTKGASNSIDSLKWYKGRTNSLSRLQNNSRAWRNMMEYYVLDNWKLAISILNDGYDTYGSIQRYHSHETQYYGGNFWWSKSEYITTRPNINNDFTKSRYNAEIWILTNGGGKYYNTIYLRPDPTKITIRKGIYNPQNPVHFLFDSVIYSLYYIFDGIYRKLKND